MIAAVLGLGTVGARPAAADPIAGHARPGHDALVQGWLDQNLPRLLSLYRQVHASPELSLQERKTAALVARELGKAGYRVSSGVGGHGVVGVLENGPGPVLLVRGDMDALPVAEETGLPYASRVRAKNDQGQTVSVMHACGHDLHVANLLGFAGVMAAQRKAWSGTLLIIGQPAEELGEGARLMIDAGLFSRFPRPSYTLALHVDSEIASGHVGVLSGWVAANADAVDVTLYGRGGHGARPQSAIDPVVIAAHYVTALQTLVSRRSDPQDPSVVTVGSIHAGTKNNVIPDDARLQITVRSYSDDSRKVLLDGVAQLARDLCSAFLCTKPPDVKIKQNYTPAVYNDPELAGAVRNVLQTVLGEAAIETPLPSMGGEDFGRFARALQVPGFLLRLGAVSEATRRKHAAPGAPPLPTLHSSRFAPDVEAALPTGIRALSAIAVALLPGKVAPSTP